MYDSQAIACSITALQRVLPKLASYENQEGMGR